MGPRIQYTKRPDGARTAYATMGAGPFLIMPPGGNTHIEWYSGDTKAQELFCERLAERRTLVLYDRHGCGLSDRRRTAFTPEDDMLDLDAVIAAVGAQRFDLLGTSWGGLPAQAYAAAHPDRVRRMVLYGTGAQGPRGPSEAERERSAALNALRRADWELYAKTQASIFFPSGTGQEQFQSLVRMLRDSTTAELAERLEDVHFDTQSVLAQISTPTLVLHRRGDQAAPFAWGEYLARHLPNVRFIPLEGDAHYPWVDDVDSVLRPTIEFLTEGDKDTAAPEPGERQEGMVVVLFTDIADSTALTQRLGDAGAQELVRAHDTIVRKALSARGGSEIKHTGDGIMASFPTASSALECAIAIQGAVDSRGEAHLRVHIGLNAGEPVAEDSDLFGTAVQLARRICDHAADGEILVSDVVRQLAAGKGFAFVDRGPSSLKGFSEAIPLYELRWKDVPTE